jgi:hypothetical protein
VAFRAFKGPFDFFFFGSDDKFVNYFATDYSCIDIFFKGTEIKSHSNSQMRGVFRSPLKITKHSEIGFENEIIWRENN